MNQRETGWEDVNWIHLILGRYIGSLCEHGKASSGSIKGGELLDQLRGC
jgi:hypothetical protein